MAVVFDSTDLDVVGEFVRDAYSSMRFNPHGQRRGVRFAQDHLPGIRLDHVTWRMRFDVGVEPVGEICLGQGFAGSARYRDRHGERVYGKGDVFLVAQPQEAFHSGVDDFVGRHTVIDSALLDEVAQTAPSDRGPVRLLAHEPVSPAAGQQWSRVAEAVSSIADSPDLRDAPLVASSAARLLAATTLATFPNTTLTDPTIEDRHDAHPDTLRRAVAFIESHPDRDITVADIAAAAFVTTRAVQLAFRRHLDTTPMHYLQTVRMDRAHRDLVAADPARTTVTSIAARWGYASPSRFAAYYRTAYGVAPSRTLHERS